MEKRHNESYVLKDGVYGKLVASRGLPKDFTGEVSLTARGTKVLRMLTTLKILSSLMNQ